MYILFIYTLLLIVILLYYVNHRDNGAEHDADFKAKVQQSFIKFVEENLPKKERKETRALNAMRTMNLNGTSIDEMHAKILKERAAEIQKEYLGLRSKKVRLKGYCTPNQKLACSVLYLKTINTFLKNNIHVCKIKQIVEGTQK